MPNTFSQRVAGVAAALAATGALAPSADACHTRLARAGNFVAMSAYAAEFGVEQGPSEHHDFIHDDLASARALLDGPACAGVAVGRAEVGQALVKIDEGGSAPRTDDWAGSAEALGVAEDALRSASPKVWRPAHPN